MVTDEQVAALRAHLALNLDESEQLHQRLVQTGDVAGYGELVYAAFVMAVRWRFAPMWTVPDVVRFVVAARVRLSEDDIDIDPRASEALIRRALGEDVAAELDEEIRGRTQVFLMSELIFDEDLSNAGLDKFLAEARALAEQRFTAH
jgi:hypothetical protein